LIIHEPAPSDPLAVVVVVVVVVVAVVRSEE
jgi:hypothetical protein